MEGASSSRAPPKTINIMLTIPLNYVIIKAQIQKENKAMVFDREVIGIIIVTAVISIFCLKVLIAFFQQG